MKIILILMTLLSTNAFAMIAKPNNLKIYPSGATRISRVNYDQAIDLVYNHYAPLLAQQGWTLNFQRLWDDPTVNSDTYQSGRTIIINSYGGLARHPLMRTVAEYAFVACHELGHSLGGMPRYRGESLSVEGQSDRWAALGCMKAIGYDLATIRDSALRLTTLLADLDNEPPPSVPGPRQPDYRGIMEGHPPAQCRLNEMRGAALFKPRKKCWYNP